jgi:hypothetical protein
LLSLAAIRSFAAAAAAADADADASALEVDSEVHDETTPTHKIVQRNCTDNLIDLFDIKIIIMSFLFKLF